jgi:single-strand DNA-binding protein
MAGDMNRWNGVGRLTKNPELKYTKDGSSVCTFSIASNRIYFKNSEKKEKVSYFQCVAWGKTGESIFEHCKKGMRIGIDGHLDQRSWEDSSGGKHSAVDIQVDTFQFLDTKKDNSTREGDPAPDPAHTNFEDTHKLSDDDMPS